MAGNLNKYLAQLLQIHWLRPETALWRSFDCCPRHNSAASEDRDGVPGPQNRFLNAVAKVAENLSEISLEYFMVGAQHE